jgi:hypothetical protein
VFVVSEIPSSGLIIICGIIGIMIKDIIYGGTSPNFTLPGSAFASPAVADIWHCRDSGGVIGGGGGSVRTLRVTSPK